MKKIRILNILGNNFSNLAKKNLEEIADVDFFEGNQKDLLNIIENYQIILVGLGFCIDKTLIDAATLLRAIVTVTTGLDHIDFEYAKKRGVVVLSLRGEDKFLNTITGTAELAFGLMLSLMRFIPWSFDSVKDGMWDRDGFRGNNILGKTLGIMGLGRLGKWMAKYGEGFGMKIVFCDPNIKKSPNKKWKKVSFDKLVKTSDIVSVHVHLNNKTENMFNKSVFDKMKRTSYIINTSRGKIVNEKDLLLALKEKKIAGYGTDVLSGELQFINNTFSNYPLVEYAKENKNVIIVPHIGGMTHESREATDIFISKKIKKFLKKYETREI